MRTAFLVLTILLAGCTSFKKSDIQSKPVFISSNFSTLENWSNDNHQEALKTFQKSCMRIVKNDPSKAFGTNPQMGLYSDWIPLCQQALNNPNNAKAFFENNFTPYLIKDTATKKDGLFTGYYEPTLKGSKTKGGVYQTPIYERPSDLIMVNLGDFREELKGQRIAGRVIEGNLKPYESHAEINANGLKDTKIMAWVDNPVDAFFLQIQGSGRIVFEDGSFIRAGYAAQNGHPYYAVGKALIENGALEKDNVSLQTIKAWLRAHPTQAQSLMEKNPSFVFFRQLETDGVVGGENVVLTPTRSLAIDRSLYPYGVPVWLDIEGPTGSPKIQRLMVAQDTGGAINGVVRGDFFWGPGDKAEQYAGIMKSKGQYWFLIPQSISKNK
ncbi:MAG: murein transglycosylase [Micavibrio sp.]|nr:murein transglycosylase [Micavibrio sp.]